MAGNSDGIACAFRVADGFRWCVDFLLRRLSPVLCPCQQQGRARFSPRTRAGAPCGLTIRFGLEGRRQVSSATVADEASSEPRQVGLAIGGMTCAACAARVEKKLNGIDSVDATVNFATGQALVTAPVSGSGPTARQRFAPAAARFRRRNLSGGRRVGDDVLAGGPRSHQPRPGAGGTVSPEFTRTRTAGA